MFFCIRTYNNRSIHVHHDYQSLNADTYKLRSHTISCVKFYYYHVEIEMNSQTKISDFSSDASTEIILDNTSQETDIKIHNKISIVKDNIKIELESKGTVTQPGNILYLSSFAKPWLDLVENYLQNSFGVHSLFTLWKKTEDFLHTYIPHVN